jgi:predicted transcriptional regulator
VFTAIYRNTMGLARDISADQKACIIAYRKLGKTQKEIAELVGCSQATVSRVLLPKKIIKKRPGPTRIMTTPKRKKLAAALVKNKSTRRQNLAKASALFSKQNGGQKVSTRTIQRALKKEGVRSCVPRRKPLISAKNKARRLEFAEEHSSWTVEDWKKVL